MNRALQITHAQWGAAQVSHQKQHGPPSFSLPHPSSVGHLLNFAVGRSIRV